MMPDGNTAASQDPDLLIQRDMVSYIYSHYRKPISLEEIAAAGKSAAINAVRFSAAIWLQLIFLNHYRLEVCHLLNTTQNVHRGNLYACGFNHQNILFKIFLRTYHCTPKISGYTAENLPTTAYFFCKRGLLLKKDEFC